MHTSFGLGLIIEHDIKHAWYFILFLCFDKITLLNSQIRLRIPLDSATNCILMFIDKGITSGCWNTGCNEFIRWKYAFFIWKKKKKKKKRITAGTLIPYFRFWLTWSECLIGLLKLLAKNWDGWAKMQLPTNQDLTWPQLR